AYDEFLQGFLTERGKHRLLKKLQTEIIPAEFTDITILHTDIVHYFEQALQFGFKHDSAIIHLVKAQIYLKNDRTLQQLIAQANEEIGEHFPIIVAQTVYEQAKRIFKKEK
ncbi:hypothetical protein EDC44_1561, partial [Cricetibacter osteomyelitidis]